MAVSKVLDSSAPKPNTNPVEAYDLFFELEVDSSGNLCFVAGKVTPLSLSSFILTGIYQYNALSSAIGPYSSMGSNWYLGDNLGPFYATQDTMPWVWKYTNANLYNGWLSTDTAKQTDGIFNIYGYDLELGWLYSSSAESGNGVYLFEIGDFGTLVETMDGIRYIWLYNAQEWLHAPVSGG